MGARGAVRSGLRWAGDLPLRLVAGALGKHRLAEAIRTKRPTLRFMAVSAGNYLHQRLGSNRAIAPAMVIMEPTAACNLACPHCFRQTQGTVRQSQLMSLEFFETFVRRNRWHLTHIQFGMWGEPLVNKKLPEMVAAARRAGVRCALITNGTLVTDELMQRLGRAGLSTITVSVDSIREEYVQIRKSPFEDVIRGLRIALAHKDTYGYRIEVGSISETRLYDEPAIRRYFDSLSDRIDRVYFQPNYTDARHRDVPFERPCYRLWHVPAVFADGKVTMCCFDNDRKHMIGDANTHSLRQIFNDRKIVGLRKAFRAGHAPKLCQECHPHYR